MTKKAAREEELGALHSKVAKVMTNALDVIDKAQDLFLDADPEDLKDIDIPTVSPPLLAVITKFLSDNSITCVPEEAAGMSDLEQRMERLRNQRKKRNGTDGNIVSFPDAGSD